MACIFVFIHTLKLIQPACSLQLAACSFFLPSIPTTFLCDWLPEFAVLCLPCDRNKAVCFLQITIETLNTNKHEHEK